MNPDDFQLDVDAMEFAKDGIDFQEDMRRLKTTSVSTTTRTST
ncbi:hypothetical protein [uncultured phage MedDCM-OCT-S05-C532]|nr:hypothetical protein [uncultured phage MedDCM-OCT-S05-C532]